MNNTTSNNDGGDYVANGMELDHENPQMSHQMVEFGDHAQSAMRMRAQTEFNSPPDYGF